MSISELIQIRCKNNKKNENVEMGSTLFDIFPKLNLKMVHGPLSISHHLRECAPTLAPCSSFFARLFTTFSKAVW